MLTMGKRMTEVPKNKTMKSKQMTKVISDICKKSRIALRLIMQYHRPVSSLPGGGFTATYCTSSSGLEQKCMDCVSIYSDLATADVNCSGSLLQENYSSGICC